MKLNCRLIALAAAVLLALGTFALAEGTLTVQGVGTVSVDADIATISLGVRVIDDDAVSAMSAVNARIDGVIGAVDGLKLGTPSVSTNSVGIYANYDYEETETITGYTAYNNICITLSDIDAAGAVIDAAFAAGANSLDYVDFSVSDTAEAGRKALALAVEGAKEKAAVLAEAAGVKLGDILEIREGGNGGYVENSAMAKAEEADEGTRLLPSAQRVSAAVTVTFAIGD